MNAGTENGDTAQGVLGAAGSEHVEWLTKAEVAAELGCPESTVTKLMAKNRIRAVTVYPADAVRAVPRPGQGTRTDVLRALAHRIVDEAPLARQSQVHQHVLADGIVVLVSWHQLETFPSGQADAVEVEPLDSVRAIAPTRVLDDTETPSRVQAAGERRWVYGVDLRDPDTVLAALVRVVAAARRDHAADRAAHQARQDARAAALADLTAAAQRVAAGRQPGHKHDFPAACDHRRFVVRSHRDSDRPVLSQAEIAAAADMTVDEVQQA